MKATVFRHYAVLAQIMALTLLVAGCPPVQPPGGSTGEGKAALKPFESGAELLTYFREQALAQRANRTTNIFGGGADLAPGATGAEPAAVPQDGAVEGGNESGESTSYTTTNIQEEGVDESDVFKSDGINFYIAKGKTLRIVRAVPMGEMEEVGSAEFDDYIDSIYLLGTKVLVLAQKGTYGGGPMPLGGPGMRADVMMWPPYYLDATAVVSEVDVSDPTAPAITRRLELDGSLVSSRVTNGRLIVVLTIAPPVPDNPNIFTMGLLTLDQVQPKLRNSAGDELPMVPPESWYHPESPDGYFTTAVMTLDANDIESVVGSVAVMANAGTIYASTEALYLTDTEYTVDNQYRETTAIHKLAFNADGVAEYVASGSVSGRLLNQFSLGEFEGYLRLATHIANFGGAVAVDVAEAPDATVSTDTRAQSNNDPHNAVYVLQESEGALEVVGSIEGIAPNENLYAARFIGARGFLVTFQQIDPLFVLDLSEPTSPTLAGELELPGYSDYLHPFGDNLLIGVGRSTRESPWGGVVRDALQLSLFDVSDLANPTLIEQIEVGGYGSESEVSYTHKAFAFLPDRGLLVLPGMLMSEQGDPWSGDYSYTPAFDGVLCYQVDATGFTELGRVTSVVYDELGWPQWRRGAFIDDVVYAVTPAGVRAASLADFAAPAKLVLTPNDDEIGGGGSSDGGGQSSPGSE
jgi:uncharacterized secreted protein with C-terminal beta-propeller domain